MSTPDTWVLRKFASHSQVLIQSQISGSTRVRKLALVSQLALSFGGPVPAAIQVTCISCVRKATRVSQFAVAFCKVPASQTWSHGVMLMTVAKVPVALCVLVSIRGIERVLSRVRVVVTRHAILRLVYTSKASSKHLVGESLLVLIMLRRWTLCLSLALHHLLTLVLLLVLLLLLRGLPPHARILHV